MTSQQRKYTYTVTGHNLLLLTLLALGIAGLSACGGGQKADPLVASYPLAYVLKPVPANTNNFESALNPAPRTPNFGAQLIIQDAAVLGAKKTTVSPPNDPATGTPRRWDVKDLEFSDDGSKLLFAAHLEPLSGADMQSWNIWQYDRSVGVAKPVIQNIFTAPQGDDVTPHYLLDGSIIFASNRNITTRSVLLAQGSAGFAPVTERSDGGNFRDSFKLHVMDKFGTTIKQVSFGTGHDLNPSLMRSGPYSGKIIFSRWDTKGNTDNRMNLYMINPDGTNEQYMYGWNSHLTGTANDPSAVYFTKPMQLGNGKVLSILRHDNDTFNGGDLVAIDINNYVDFDTLVATPASLVGPAQESLTSGLGSTQTNSTTAPGKFISVAPYYDGTDRAIVAYGPNNVVAGALAPPLYYPGVFTFKTLVLQLLTDKVPVNNYYADVAIAQDKAPPRDIFSNGASSLNTGFLHIRNVLPANVSSTTATRVLLYKHAYMDSTTALNPMLNGNANSQNFKMRELIGYAKIYSDGSVRTRVPADVPITFEIVNDKFEKIVSSQGSDHPAWFTVRGGEERTCNGCHVSTTPPTPHGRFDAETPVNISLSKPLTDAQLGTTDDPVTMNPQMDPSNLIGDPLNIISTSANYPVNFSTKCLSQATWDGTCRVIIDFSSIQSPDGVLDSGGALLPSLWSAAPKKGCVSCHSITTDISGNPVPPKGGFDLTITGEANAGDPTNYAAYTNLMTRITPGSATGSTFLYISPGVPRFAPGVLHPTTGGVADRFTPGEIKLITEWINNGAQYQNHP